MAEHTGTSALVVNDETSITYHGCSDDAQLVELWLCASQSVHTRRAYERDASSLLSYVNRPLRAVTLADLQGWCMSLTGSDSSKARRIAAIKSMLAFARSTGYLPHDVGSVLKAPRVRNRLAERILTEEQIIQIVSAATSPRDAAMLRVIYSGGLRASEVCALSHRDVVIRDGGRVQITVWGKGSKERTILLSETTSSYVLSLPSGAPDDPLFASRAGRRLDPSAIFRALQRAARAANIGIEPSPHWLRHSHASHALDRGAPIHVVQQTLGHASLQSTTKYVHARPSDSSSQYLPI